MKIWALEDGQEAGLTCLGTLRVEKALPCRVLRLGKRIVIPGAGRYCKELAVPLYANGAVRRYRGGQPQAQRAPLLGVTGPRKPLEEARGYIRRQEGAYGFCLAVFPLEAAAGLGWRMRGFLSTQEGWVAVATRRVWFWIWLALAAAVVFTLSYSLFRHGWAQGGRMLLESLQDLPEALEGAWFGFWHRLG